MSNPTKKQSVAKSTVLFEVKPIDDQQNLDDLAKKVMDIPMEGLVWTQGYKKVPIGFGIEKLQIGCC